MKSARRPWAVRLLAWGCWLYLAIVLAAWVVLRVAADRWWPATLLMFGPRWLLAVPLGILVAGAVVVRRRLLGLLLPAGVVLAGPVMGFQLPWRTLWLEDGAQLRVRVLTCNIHRDELDPAALRSAIEESNPDMVVLQDWRDGREQSLFGRQGWHFRADRDMALASRFPVRAAAVFKDPPFGVRGEAVRYDLETPAGLVRFFNLHLASPRGGFEALLGGGWRAGPAIQANSDLRWGQSAALRRWVEQTDGPVVLAGDFNTPPQSVIHREFWSPFTNAFSSAGLGFGNTYFTRRAAVRIDHILAGDGWQCRRCWVGPPVGSPHRPVLADLEWTGPRPR
jgi:endonuclease/exonuclease/phosphatase (EEP) superfamily protein YafD